MQTNYNVDQERQSNLRERLGAYGFRLERWVPWNSFCITRSDEQPVEGGTNITFEDAELFASRLH